jgi:phosphohistidine phosphatase
MEVYLLRHAIAVESGTPGYSEESRPLTPEGIEKMKNAARGIAELVPEFDLILTSPLVRARETAVVAKELAPGATTRDTSSMLATYAKHERLLLVGHEPGLSRFATSLLGGDTSVLEFRKGALARIDLSPAAPREPGTLIYLLPPKVLRALGAKHRQPRTS